MYLSGLMQRLGVGVVSTQQGEQGPGRVDDLAAVRVIVILVRHTRLQSHSNNDDDRNTVNVTRTGLDVKSGSVYQVRFTPATVCHLFGDEELTGASHFGTGGGLPSCDQPLPHTK